MPAEAPPRRDRPGAGSVRDAAPAPGAEEPEADLGRAPEPARRGSLLPFVGVASLFVLVAITLHVSAALRRTLEDELAARLRISADLAADALASSDYDPARRRNGQKLTAQLQEIRASTGVSEILLYDRDGDLRGGATPSAAVGMNVPRSVRVGALTAGSADAWQRLPERDVSGGIALLVPLAEAAGGGAVLTRIDPGSQGGLPAIDFLFQVAKALAGVVTAAGFLILLRWASGGNRFVARPAPETPGSDVGMVLGTVKEVMTTLKDSETTYRDRWTAAEADADSQRRRSDQIVASIESGLLAFDSAGRVTLFNLGAQHILGLRAGATLGRPVRELFDESDPLRRTTDELLRELHAPARSEWERSRPDGEPCWLALSSSVIRDRNGVPQGGILLIDDLTETKRLRDAAGLKDRLAAVGEMSAGIAHEIKNSLHALMGHANLLREDHPDAEPPLAVRGILTEVRALETMVKSVLEFSKPTRLIRGVENLNEMLTELLDSLRERAESAEVTVATELAGDLPAVPVEATSLRHAFLNCVLNAIEAMESRGGGTLTVSTRTTEMRSDDDGGSRPAVRVSFRDTGPGIEESDRQRIFTPFYSTKRDGHGLGLALVHRTVTAHGGRLHLHSRPDVGTEFVIVLPAEGDA